MGFAKKYSKLSKNEALIQLVNKLEVAAVEGFFSHPILAQDKPFLARVLKAFISVVASGNNVHCDSLAKLASEKYQFFLSSSEKAVQNLVFMQILAPTEGNIMVCGDRMTFWLEKGIKESGILSLVARSSKGL